MSSRLFISKVLTKCVEQFILLFNFHHLERKEHKWITFLLLIKFSVQIFWLPQKATIKDTAGHKLGEVYAPVLQQNAAVGSDRLGRVIKCAWSWHLRMMLSTNQKRGRKYNGYPWVPVISLSVNCSLSILRNQLTNVQIMLFLVLINTCAVCWYKRQKKKKKTVNTLHEASFFQTLADDGFVEASWFMDHISAGKMRKRGKYRIAGFEMWSLWTTVTLWNVGIFSFGFLCCAPQCKLSKNS